MTNKYKPKFKGMKQCKNCGKLFPVYRDWQTFCSSACRIDSWRKAHADPQKISEIERRLRIVEEKLEHEI